VNFDLAFERLMGHEGRYSFNPKDAGGETQWGISKRSYPHLDIRNLTEDEAKAIYKKDFWDAMRIEKLPPLIQFDVFDASVNAGRQRASQLLQRSAGVLEDGLIGTATMAAINSMEPSHLLARFVAHRLIHMCSLDTFSTFGRGWTRRCANNLLEALK
jgi:lysozyme family protein